MAFPFEKKDDKKGKGKKKGKLAKKAEGKSMPPWLMKKKGGKKEDCK